MKIIEALAGALLVSSLATTLVACDRDGPFEESGEEIDDALDKVGDAVEGASLQR